MRVARRIRVLRAMWLVGVGMLFPVAGALVAQTASGRTGSRIGRRAVELHVGISRSSSQWGQLGDMPGERLTLTGLRFIQQVRRPDRDGVAVEYSVDLIPMAMTSPSYREDVQCAGSCDGVADPRAGAPAHGAGITPLSLTVIARANRAFQLRVGAAGGALWFDRPVPTTTAARFNLTGSLDAGAQFMGRGGNGVVLLYQFHHLSNAGFGAENPGIASHVVSLGARWRMGARR
jgi:hypothetical protein